jgi:hypothetical protein
MEEFFWGEFLPLLSNKNPVQVLHGMFVTKLKLKLVFHINPEEKGVSNLF